MHGRRCKTIGSRFVSGSIENMRGGQLYRPSACFVHLNPKTFICCQWTLSAYFTERGDGAKSLKLVKHIGISFHWMNTLSKEYWNLLEYWNLMNVKKIP